MQIQIIQNQGFSFYFLVFTSACDTPRPFLISKYMVLWTSGVHIWTSVLWSTHFLPLLLLLAKVKALWDTHLPQVHTSYICWVFDKRGRACTLQAWQVANFIRQHTWAVHWSRFSLTPGSKETVLSCSPDPVSWDVDLSSHIHLFAFLPDLDH